MDKKTLIIFTGGPGTGKSKTAEKFMDFLADDQIVKISYILRDCNTDRHPGHLLSTYHKETFQEEVLSKIEQPSYKEFVSGIVAKDYNIALGESILLDVTDFARIDYESIFTRISRS